MNYKLGFFMLVLSSASIFAMQKGNENKREERKKNKIKNVSWEASQIVDVLQKLSDQVNLIGKNVIVLNQDIGRMLNVSNKAFERMNMIIESLSSSSNTDHSSSGSGKTKHDKDYSDDEEILYIEENDERKLKLSKKIKSNNHKRQPSLKVTHSKSLDFKNVNRRHHKKKELITTKLNKKSKFAGSIVESKKKKNII